MRYILDTSALLAHHRNEEGADRVQELFEESGAQIFVASITLTEFSRRMRALEVTPAEISRMLGDYCLLFRSIVSIDGAIARQAFVISEAGEERIPLADSLIAAAAASINATLVHRDSHFSGIPIRQLVQELLR